MKVSELKVGQTFLCGGGTTYRLYKLGARAAVVVDPSKRGEKLQFEYISLGSPVFLLDDEERAFETAKPRAYVNPFDALKGAEVQSWDQRRRASKRKGWETRRKNLNAKAQRAAEVAA